MFWCFPIVPMVLSLAAYWNGWKAKSVLPLLYVPFVWIIGSMAEGSGNPSALLAANVLSISLSLVAVIALFWMAWTKPKPKPQPVETDKHNSAGGE